jgi:hypothetical protein
MKSKWFAAGVLLSLGVFAVNPRPAQAWPGEHCFHKTEHWIHKAERISEHGIHKLQAGLGWADKQVGRLPGMHPRTH